MRHLFVLGLAGVALVPGALPGQTFAPGIWRSQGYGDLIVVNDSGYEAYSITATTCTPRETGGLAQVPNLFKRIEQRSSNEVVVSGDYYRYSYLRADSIPARCSPSGGARGPRAVFDAFWQSMHENYAFFELRKINWDSLGLVYRARISDTMSNRALYTTLGAMVELVDDPHVFVSNGKQGADDISFGASRPRGIARAITTAQPKRPTAFVNASKRAAEQAIEAVARLDVLHGDYSTGLNDRLVWGMAAPNVGFIRSQQFVGQFPRTATRQQSDAILDSTLDVVFTELSRAKAVVVDLTNNPGGGDFVPMAIAARMLREPIVAFSKQAKTPSGLTEPLTVTLVPSPRPGIRAEVVVMVSSNTFSAGETLPLVLRKLPWVTIFGERTAGAFSDILMMQLPDGGRLGIANERLTDRYGNSPEMTGIVPDVAAEIWSPRALVNGYRTAVDSAVALARRRVAR